VTPDRIAWLRLEADEIERGLPPQTNPHEWEASRAAAAAMRYLADLWENTLEKAA